MKFETDDIGCTILQMRMQKKKRRDVVQKATPRSNPDGIVLAIYIILLHLYAVISSNIVLQNGVFWLIWQDRY